MELQHEFTVPVSADEAFAVLTDIDRVAPCMPGATLEDIDGDEFTGQVKVKVGPMQVTYQGSARFTEKDPDAHRATLEARGQQQRGAGTADATVRAELTSGEDGTTVTVTTDLAVTGRPAQFGRGVMDDVGEKLLGQFADCLADELAGGGGDEEEGREVPADGGAGEPATAPAGGGVGAARPAPGAGGDGRRAAPRRPRPSDDVIDLMEVAGPSVLRRFGPAVAAAVVLALLVWWVSKR